MDLDKIVDLTRGEQNDCSNDNECCPDDCGNNDECAGCEDEKCNEQTVIVKETVVKYIDPISEEYIKDKCNRLGLAHNL